MYVSRVRNLSDSCPRLSTPFLCFQNSSAACWRYLLPRAGVGTCTDATIPGLTTSHYARSRVQIRGSFKRSTCVHKLLKPGWTTFSGSQQLHLPDQRLRSAYGASDRCHGCGSKFLSESLSDDWLMNFSSGIGHLELGLKQMNSPCPLPASTCKLPHSTAKIDFSPSECMLAQSGTIESDSEACKYPWRP